MKTVVNDKNAIFWQSFPEGGGEPALLITSYNDIICIRQEDRYININYEIVNELCKHLKSLKQPEYPCI